MKRLSILCSLLIPTLAQAEVIVHKQHPFNPQIFTQGLERNDQGKLLYSSGLYGQSEIGYLTLGSTQKESVNPLPPHYFAEGLTITPYGIWQISWREQTAFLRDPQTLKVIKTVHYSGEGWGLAYDKSRDLLWLSDGSDKLQTFNPCTFEKQGELSISYLNKPITLLNELEFANGFLYANLWQSNQLAKIDVTTGNVQKFYDFSPLVQSLNLTHPDDVLNGIAHLQGSRFLITGKRFPVIWEVELGDWEVFNKQGK